MFKQNGSESEGLAAIAAERLELDWAWHARRNHA